MKLFLTLAVILLPAITAFSSLDVRLSNNPYKISTDPPFIIRILNHGWSGSPQVKYEYRIFDQSGRLVHASSPPADATLPFFFPAWNGLNKAGMRVYSGVYIVHLTAENTTVNKEDKMKFRLGVLQQ